MSMNMISKAFFVTLSEKFSSSQSQVSG